MFFRTKMECHSPWCNAWTFSMEILGCPNNKIYLLAFLMLSSGKPGNMPGIRLAAGVAGKIAMLQSDRLWGSTPDFSFRLTPLAFPIQSVTTRQWCYLTDSWGLYMSTRAYSTCQWACILHVWGQTSEFLFVNCKIQTLN